MQTRSADLQAVLSEIVKLAVTSGSHEARISRLEVDNHNRMSAVPPSQRRVSTHDMRSAMELLRLMGKVALWLAPRALMAYGVISGWFAAAWRWVQLLVASGL